MNDYTNSAFALGETRPVLRDADSSDRSFLIALYASIREHQLAWADWPAEMRRVFVQMQYDAQSAEYTRRYPASRCRILEQRGCPVGRLWLACTESAVRLLDLCVVPALQRQGLGSDVLQRVLDDAREMSLPVELQVASGSPAQRLFERHGFTPLPLTGMHRPMRWTAGDAAAARRETALDGRAARSCAAPGLRGAQRRLSHQMPAQSTPPTA